MADPAIHVEGVVKRFRSTTALAGVDLDVEEATVFGLLGPNGAGKTTLVRVLATLLAPDAGRAEVFGRLFDLSAADARRRANELLERFDLADAADRPARTYSGGMRRRLDLAASLVGRPDVIFLDEPTTGLDPESRMGMWEIVQTLVGDGTTVLLTTQYLDEADRLADSITVLSQGRVVASGTASELKAQVGKRTVVVTLSDPSDGTAAVHALEQAGLQPVLDGERHAVITPVDRSAELAVVVRALDQDSIEVAELALTEPTLDDVYLTLAHAPAAA